MKLSTKQPQEINKMSFKKAKSDGVYKKTLLCGNIIHYFSDGICFAEIVLSPSGENVDSIHNTFKVGSIPCNDLTVLANK